ncbi:MAG: acyl-CoA dehydrogenase family protein [Pseudomonadales bacterium]|jgi:alkylation response protein AidB-like acyl-CoA dehydrogenase|tara:strand:- start:650 stop:1813 length:1164 start_codon:yes stop_codon:yes gene_type:complete
MGHQQLINVARKILPELSERSGEIDALRQIPQDLADKMAAEGFYRICTPAQLGGLAQDPNTLYEICETLASANGSAGWCIFIGSTSQYLLGALAQEQQHEMMTDINVITSGVFADMGTALYEERDNKPGYLINGHWRWGSGCRNAAWISGGIHEIDGNGDAHQSTGSVLTRVFFKPEEIEILDNWHVSGMRGSGSSDYRVENVWVPAARMASSIEQTELRHLPIYRYPKFALLALPIGAITLGMARASINEVIKIANQKTPQGSRRTLAHRPGLHRDIGVADSKLSAAREYLYALSEEVWQHCQTKEPTVQQRQKLRAANVHAVNTAVDVIDKMYTLVGGTSVFETSCLQQHFRDVHVATQHMMVGEPVMELAGRVLLGLDDVAPGL